MHDWARFSINALVVASPRFRAANQIIRLLASRAKAGSLPDFGTLEALRIYLVRAGAANVAAGGATQIWDRYQRYLHRPIGRTEQRWRGGADR
jgi:hypothetical protein